MPRTCKKRLESNNVSMTSFLETVPVKSPGIFRIVIRKKKNSGQILKAMPEITGHCAKDYSLQDALHFISYYMKKRRMHFESFFCYGAFQVANRHLTAVSNNREELQPGHFLPSLNCWNGSAK